MSGNSIGGSNQASKLDTVPTAPATEWRSGPDGPGRRDNPVQIREAAQQFEALLIAHLLKTARESGSEGWLGAGEDPSASSAVELAEEQFARALAAQGGLGLAALVAAGLTSERQGPER